MPELPEVEYTARQLRASVVGTTIQEALVFWSRTVGHPGVAEFCAEIAGRRIEGIRRRGKFLLIDLSGDFFLSIHRRMTGNFLLLPPGWSIDTSLRELDPTTWDVKGPTFYHGLADKIQTDTRVVPAAVGIAAIASAESQTVEASYTMYCRVCFNFNDGRRLLFTDPRKFGRVELWPRTREAEVFAALGPEPLSDDFTVEHLAQSLAQRKMSIKAALLAQEVVTGIGNIYADEALFYAAIHPLRPANTLTAAELVKLREAIIVVLKRGIEHGGTSFNDYRDLWGEAGENYNHVRVYQREGQPCINCGTSIERIIIAQRSTRFCPQCQQMAPYHGKEE
jgi:formamidopyrimidine-DNA glycosylase